MAMSRNGRLGLVALAVVVAVVAFVIAKPGDEEEKAGKAPGETATTETGTTIEQRAAEPERPAVKRIVIRKARPVGGVRELRFESGEVARIEVSSDAPDELHLHGYDIEREAEPGRPARFRFEANAEGEFVLESHTAEHAGNDPVIARLLIGPS
jgi:FtsP/CotA-like multicopper oxidase with cupredoxin domain